MGGSGKECVSLPAPPARGDRHLLPILQDLRHDLAGGGVAQNRTQRHGHDDVRTPAPTLVRPHPVLAALGYPLVAVGVVEKGREVGIAANDDAAAAAPVAAVRAAHRSSPLATERGATRSPGSTFYSDYCAVNEQLRPRRLDRVLRLWSRIPKQGAVRFAASSLGAFPSPSGTLEARL